LKFGTAVRVARNIEGIAQHELAKQLKISNTYLCDIERNRNLPAYPLAWKIQQRFPNEKLIQAYQETYRNTLPKL
jgi:DNA-binding XRE family transcriptional regulator